MKDPTFTERFFLRLATDIYCAHIRKDGEEAGGSLGSLPGDVVNMLHWLREAAVAYDESGDEGQREDAEDLGLDLFAGSEFSGREAVDCSCDTCTAHRIDD